MKRSLKLAVVGVLIAAGIALADVTVSRTWQSAGATVDEMHFITLPDAGVAAVVCGHTTLSGGGNSPGNCTAPVELPNGQMKTDIINLRTNRALPHWKTNNPEAPGL